MEALFIIPALVSPNVPERLVPGLAKLVERNMLLTYSSSIRNAAMRRYANLLTTATTESVVDEFLNEASYSSKTGKDPRGETSSSSFEIDKDLISPGSGSSKEIGYTPVTAKPDSVELPRGITFYTNISLEPTMLEIPIEVNRYPLGVFGTKSEKIIRIGMKCVPYTFDKVKDIKNAIKNPASKRMARSKFGGFVNRLTPKIRKKYENVYRGKETTGNLLQDVMIGPSSDELANPRILSKLMTPRASSRWSSLVIFTTFDFQDSELKELLKNYQQYVKQGWGDIIVVNEDRESISFCMQKMMACQEVPYTYLRKMLSLDDVLDYKEISRYTKPFRLTSLRTAFRESCGIEVSGEDIDINELFEKE